MQVRDFQLLWKWSEHPWEDCFDFICILLRAKPSNSNEKIIKNIIVIWWVSKNSAFYWIGFQKSFIYVQLGCLAINKKPNHFYCPVKDSNIQKIFFRFLLNYPCGEKRTLCPNHSSSSDACPLSKKFLQMSKNLIFEEQTKGHWISGSVGDGWGVWDWIFLCFWRLSSSWSD